MRPSPRLITALRWLLLTTAGLATVVALFVVIENWRGDRAWAATERELHARGERLDFAAFQPAPVPDAENLFKAPQFARILYGDTPGSEGKKILADAGLTRFHALGAFHGPLKDFTALRDQLKNDGVQIPNTESPAADVLLALEPLKFLLDDLRNAARERPRAALAPRATLLGVPQVNADAVYHLAQALGVRASAALALGRVDDAHADIFALQRLANALADHPATLLNLLVGVSMQGLAADPIAEGCTRHLWNERQLLEFQHLAEALHPLAGFRNALNVERAFVISMIDSQPKLPSREFNWPWWMFHGWAQQNKVTQCRRLDAEIFAAFAVAPERIFPERLVEQPKSARPPPAVRAPYGFLADLAMTNLGNILGGLGNSVDRLRLRSVATALERHRLARGRYPDALDELVPALLPAVPIGVFDGKPLRYRRLPEGGHELYSLGKNGRDDAGQGDDIVVLSADPS